MTIDSLKVGQKCRILRVNGEGALRKRLLDMGLTPGTDVSLHKVAPMGDPMEFTLRGYHLTIRKEEGARIDAEETL